MLKSKIFICWDIDIDFESGVVPALTFNQNSRVIVTAQLNLNMSLSLTW